MAERPAFSLCNGRVIDNMYAFEWFPGFAVSQKRKCIESLHNVITDGMDVKALEVSTKSLNPLGVRLSAFNLKLGGYPLENVFQSSKVFENGGPYLDLLNVLPREAKRDKRLCTSGKLVGFQYNDLKFSITPISCFYDYIYIEAVRESLTEDDIVQILGYDYFTDIEFNPKRSVNTQARSVALVKLLKTLYGDLPKFSLNDFIIFHSNHVIYNV